VAEQTRTPSPPPQQAQTGTGSQIGKRYFCAICGSEFVVTKAGSGTLTCHGQPLTMK
jgi:hypothetical protein